MGLSFHNESTMVEASIGSLRFAPDIANPISENGMIDEERRHDDPEIQLSDDSDIQMVDKWIVTKAKDSTITALEELANDQQQYRFWGGIYYKYTERNSRSWPWKCLACVTWMDDAP